MLKRFFLVVFFSLMLISILQAQYRRPIILNDPDYDVNKPLNFGFSLGINIMDFDIKNSNKFETDNDGNSFQYFADITHVSPGLNVNAICDLRLTENLHLRFLPGYAFGQRNLDFYKVNDSTVLETTMKMESSFIDLPLGFKYVSQRSNNVRPYLYFGGNYRIDLAAYKRLKIDKGVLIRLEKSDFYYEIGFGIDFFLTYFKFSTEIKWSAGINNALSKDYAEGAENYKNAIDMMRSKMIVIAFHFE